MKQENSSSRSKPCADAGAHIPRSPSIEAKIGRHFDKCALSGEGPHQRDVGWAYSALYALGSHIEDCTPEALFWVFMRDRYGWAILEHGTLDAIASEHRRVVDIGAGSGYVAACLNARGVDVTAVHISGTVWDHWWRRRFFPATNTPASQLDYDADAYLLLMPDERGAGEDMMAEALTRIPVGSTVYTYAPTMCAGSDLGRQILARDYERVGGLPLLNCFPWEDRHDCDIYVRRAMAARDMGPASPQSASTALGGQESIDLPTSEGAG